MNDALDRLIREARQDLGEREAREVNWRTVDERLFARIASEKQADRARFIPGPRRPWAIAVSAALAAASVALLVVVRGPTRPVDSASSGGSESLGAVASITGPGQLLVGGVPAARGTVVHRGEVIEARNVEAVIQWPGKAQWLAELGARFRLTRGPGALVIELERGAVEADVVPVAVGEALAVDVGSTRVAVHGTHLRVERVGARASIDLTEGVVTVGAPPRTGAVLGSLVTAPAHVDFGVFDPGAMIVTHDPARVRTAQPFAEASSVTGNGALTAGSPPRALPRPSELGGGGPPVAPSTGRQVRAAATSPSAVSTPTTTASLPAASAASPPPRPPRAPKRRWPKPCALAWPNGLAPTT